MASDDHANPQAIPSDATLFAHWWTHRDPRRRVDNQIKAACIAAGLIYEGDLIWLTDAGKALRAERHERTGKPRTKPHVIENIRARPK